MLNPLEQNRFCELSLVFYFFGLDKVKSQQLTDKNCLECDIAFINLILLIKQKEFKLQLAELNLLNFDKNHRTKILNLKKKFTKNTIELQKTK